MVEYRGFANSIDGPAWCVLSIHKNHMLEIMDNVSRYDDYILLSVNTFKVEENEFQQSLKYHYKVKISRNM